VQRQANIPVSFDPGGRIVGSNIGSPSAPLSSPSTSSTHWRYWKPTWLETTQKAVLVILAPVPLKLLSNQLHRTVHVSSVDCFWQRPAFSESDSWSDMGSDTSAPLSDP
jgi:hypothetical protein